MPDLQAFSLHGCHPGNLEDTGLTGSVGRGGVNHRDDVRHVQSLLNDIAPEDGGPSPQLEVDGIVGPLTLRAITDFQNKQRGRSDGRVDPGGPTLELLESMAGSGDVANAQRQQPPPAPNPQGNSAQAQAIRRQTAISVIPDARRAIAKTLLELDLIRLRIKPGQPLLPASKSELVLNRHFATGSLPAGELRSSLVFIEATFAKMKAILDGRKGFFGGDPFGANIVEADPVPPPPPKDLRNVLAYSPTQSGDRKRQNRLGISPSRLYFTALMDGKSRDFFLYTLMHELAHFVDDEKVAMIVDHAYGHQDKYQTLTHRLRKLNADCYGLLAFEFFAGNDRLAQIYPKLKVIEIDPVVIK